MIEFRHEYETQIAQDVDGSREILRGCGCLPSPDGQGEMAVRRGLLSQVRRDKHRHHRQPSHVPVQNKECRKQFSAKVGTIFEDSPIPLDKWFVAMWSITNAKNGISSCELARAIGVCQKTAWHMLHRIRLALKSGNFGKLSGRVEADEAFIGGAVANMHKVKAASGETCIFWRKRQGCCRWAVGTWRVL